jgi:hypothetical protein
MKGDANVGELMGDLIGDNALSSYAAAAAAVAAFHAPGALARATRTTVDWDQWPAAEMRTSRLVGEFGRQP